MGNCDTHLFLGSNSQKTVEYFSKALGEKTIGRDSISINRDNRDFKTGKSISDQVMARALLTPDELRRLDNDLCIIYEKGLKPIKARKYYYFENPRSARIAKDYPANHNDVQIDRGAWRKYNPYNPYQEENDAQKDVQIESLDDLFEEPEAPMLPQEEKEELSTDIQKELEAKFDELFGSLDEENKNADETTDAFADII